MVKNKTTSFTGTISELSGLTPEYGGKEFLVEVTLVDKSKAYILDQEVYQEIYKNIRADVPGDEGFYDDLYVKMPAYGEYIMWKGKKVIVSIKIGFPDDE